MAASLPESSDDIASDDRSSVDFEEDRAMRTTLDIDDDVLAAVKERAKRERVTAGMLISRLARRALAGDNDASAQSGKHGFRPFASRGKIVTNEDIDNLRDEAGV